MTAPTLAPDSWQLVTRAQAGDTDAFAALYEQYRAPIFRFVYHRVGDRLTAEEIAQDAWVKVLKRINTVEFQGRDIGAWIITIARNLVADYFKSARFRLERLTGETPSDLTDDDREVNPDAAVGDYLRSRDLITAVQRLWPDQREVIVLRFLCGYSVAETAAQMGKNEASVKALQYRAVRALARDEQVQLLAVTA